MIRSVRLRETLLELPGADRPPPEVAVLLGPGRHDAQTAAGARADSSAPGAVDDGGVHFILAPIAVDGGTRRARDHRSATALQGAPDEAINQRILERCETWLPARGKTDQPFWVLASRMRHRKQDRKVAVRLVDEWGGELAHGPYG
jgi:hypothetical protein